MDKKTALLYIKLKHYRFLEKRTLGFIRWALEKVNNPYVACSFGKDSAVLLHLILKHNPGIKVIFNKWKNESDLLHNYNDIIEWWKKNYNINLQIIEFSRDNLNKLMADRFKKNQHYKNYDACFLGLRSEESKNREFSLRHHGIFYKSKSGIVRICPLAEWKTDDIAAYIQTNDIATLWDYIKFGFNARTTARVPTDSQHARNIWINQFRKEKPFAFNELCKIYPEIQFYT